MGEPLGQWTRTSAGGSGMRRTSKLMPKTWKGIGFMGSSYHTSRCANGDAPPGQGSFTHTRERALDAGLFHPFELRLDAVERGPRIVVLVAGIGQVSADHVEGLAELVEVTPQTREALLDILGAPLDLESPQPEHDHTQIRVEAVGRHRDDTPGGGIDPGRVLVARLVPGDGLEVNV